MKKVVLVNLMIILGFMVATAQPGKGVMKPDLGYACQHFQKRPNLQLSDQQRIQIEELRLDFSKNTLEYKSQIRILLVEYHSLMSAEQQDFSEIEKNIDKRLETQSKIMKERAKLLLKIRDVLTDEQKLMLENHFEKKDHSGLAG